MNGFSFQEEMHAFWNIGWEWEIKKLSLVMKMLKRGHIYSLFVSFDEDFLALMRFLPAPTTTRPTTIYPLWANLN